MRRLAFLLLPLALAACHRGGPGAAASTASAAPADPAAPVAVHEWPLPSAVGSAQPDVAVTPDGRLLLSWINRVEGRRNALQFVAMAEDGHWQSAARTIVVGNSLMANWANTPHIAQTPDGALWVQFMQQRGEGHAGDVALSRSTDGGFNWASPIAVNDDGVEAEHGFAALWPAARDAIGVAWLDGRDNAESDMGHGAGAMAHGAAKRDGAAMRPEGRTALRAAVFGTDLQRSGETVVDAKTCDCCNTAIAATARGPLLVYRDRSDKEVRDIVAVRYDGKAWSKPVPVHADGWVMPGCPVNGPAVAADGDAVLVAWYTEAGGQPSVRVARSSDDGASFAAPLTLDQGDAVQGRAALALDAAQAWILWIREDATGQSLWLSRRTPDLKREYQRLEVAKLQGRGRATGFPKIALRGGDAYVAWTDIEDGVPRLHGAVIGR
ncbi:MAG: sialidase family protein [Luteimonas sp.]